MSLEQALKENTEESKKLRKAIEALTNSKVVDVAKTTKADKPEKDKPEKDKTEPAEGKAETSEDDDDAELTQADCKAKLKEVMEVSGKDAAKKLLDKFKVKKLPDLAEEDYPKLIAAADKHLAKAED